MKIHESHRELARNKASSTDPDGRRHDFWYNNTAKLFKMSLKTPFNPEVSEEDYLIEDILQRQFQNGRLDYQKSFQEFDLYGLSKKWKTIK